MAALQDRHVPEDVPAGKMLLICFLFFFLVILFPAHVYFSLHCWEVWSTVHRCIHGQTYYRPPVAITAAKQNQHSVPFDMGVVLRQFNGTAGWSTTQLNDMIIFHEYT